VQGLFEPPLQKFLQKYNKMHTMQGSHHTLLHEVKQQKTSTTLHHIYNSATDKKAICLPTALIRIQNQAGGYELMRALIDQCSQSTIITENAAQTLRLPKYPTYVQIFGMGNTRAGVSKHSVNIEASPRFSSKWQITMEAKIMKSPAHIQ
jgi:hypothetical protein